MSKRALVSIIDDDDSHRPRFPIVILTALADHEARARALRAGAAAFLPKRSDAAILLSAVEAALLES
jgi:DNA-binding NarL/FixJ family response regulator